MNFRLLNQDEARRPRSQFQAEQHERINSVACKRHRHAVIVEDDVDDGLVGFGEDFQILRVRDQICDDLSRFVASALTNGFRKEPVQRSGRIENAKIHQTNVGDTDRRWVLLYCIRRYDQRLRPCH